MTVPVTSTITLVETKTREITTSYISNITDIIYVYVTRTFVLRETIVETLRVRTTEIINKTLVNPVTEIVHSTIITQIPVMTTIVREKTLITEILETKTITYDSDARSTETVTLSYIDPGLSIGVSIPLLVIGILIGYYLLRRNIYNKT